MKFSLRTVSGIFSVSLFIQGGACPAQTAPGVAAATAPKQTPAKAGAKGNNGAIAPPPANNEPKPYTFGPLDVLQVTVWNAPNLSGIFDVGPDGTIQYQILGPVKVDGMTQPEVAHMLREKLVGPVFTEPPEVNVQLLRNNSKKFYVYGSVGHQGEFPLVADMTVMDAIANFGGFSTFAKTNAIRIVRGTTTYKFNYKEVSKGRKLEQNIKLQNGDRIFVDE
jgi:polysaccharide export outer membrane protein